MGHWTFSGLVWDGFGRLHHLLFCLRLPFSCRVCFYQLCWSVSDYDGDDNDDDDDDHDYDDDHDHDNDYDDDDDDYDDDGCDINWKRCCRYVLRVKYQDQDRALILQEMTFNMVGGEQNN